MSRRFVAYYRVSTDKQGRSGLGMEAQQSAVAGYLTSVPDAALLASYREVESGRKSDRPELARAVAHARRAGATLVIAKLDRLARNVHFLSGLMASGLDFVACDLPTAGRLTVHIMAAVAEEEARLISERTRAALAAYRARGGVLGTPANMALMSAADRARGQRLGSERTKQRADEAYADLVPVLRSSLAAGSSFRAIAKWLNDEGHRTRSGKAWTHTQVRRVVARCH